MRRVVWAAVALVLFVGGYAAGVRSWGAVDAQDGQPVGIAVIVAATTESADGIECFPWGLLDTSLDVGPFRQLIVTDAAGVIVQAVDLDVGALETTARGDRVCAIRAGLQPAGSAFYTFTVDGKYRRTVNADTLGDELLIHLP